MSDNEAKKFGIYGYHRWVIQLQGVISFKIVGDEANILEMYNNGMSYKEAAKRLEK